MHSLCPFYGKLFRQVLRELCRYLTTPSLVCLTTSEVLFFNCESAAWFGALRLPKTVLCDGISTYIPLDAHTLFCCGGTTDGHFSIVEKNESFVVDLRSGEVALFPTMTVHRSGAGLLRFSSQLFVFGGSKSAHSLYRVHRQ